MTPEMREPPAEDDGFPQPTGSSHDDLRRIGEWLAAREFPVTDEMIEAGVRHLKKTFGAVPVDIDPFVRDKLGRLYRTMRALEPQGTPGVCLNSAMPNIVASKLGQICLEAAAAGPALAGDSIDRGLILRRLLAESGFHLVYARPFKEKIAMSDCQKEHGKGS